MTAPGSLYVADLVGARGRKQGAHGSAVRPVLIVSDDTFRAPGLLFAVPLTTADRQLKHHVPVPANALTGLQRDSFAMTEQARALSTTRMLGPRPLGTVTPQILHETRRWIAAQLGIAFGPS
ncbi:MAG: type II toxin-antitoxin system PemK/MazF family toxin [Mycobacteriales bacterium]